MWGRHSRSSLLDKNCYMPFTFAEKRKNVLGNEYKEWNMRQNGEYKKEMQKMGRVIQKTYFFFIIIKLKYSFQYQKKLKYL